MKSAGLTPKEFTMQLALYQEYIWNRLNTTGAEDFKVGRSVGRWAGGSVRSFVFCRVSVH